MSRLANLPTVPAVLVCLMSFGADAADFDNDIADSRDEASMVIAPSASPWPTQISARNDRLVVYQPQFDKWEGDRIEGRAAVALQAQTDDQAEKFGVVWISARTETDRASEIVTIRDLAITKADFPTVSQRGGEYVDLLRRELAAKSWQVPLERLQSDMAIDRAVQLAAGQPLKNDPPKIIFSERPAILVPVDGEPVLREVPGTSLQRIINTRALILYDPALNNPAAARYYLYVIDHWRLAQRLTGPWTAGANPSADLEKAKQLAVQEDTVDLLDEDVEDGEPLDASAVVYVSTEPAELLQTEGPAQYAPIQGTQLLYVTNSPNRIFLDLGSSTHYVLLSGRWFRARGLQRGPWEYVSAGSLPGDFALIPPEHSTSPVRAAVPGTPQAREAVIANSVPRVAKVTRSAASLEITYDGEPVFQPIAGTLLQSVVNSPVPVIRVSEESFYALDNGVWFAAPSPYGPWSVASYVPAAIYSIPRSSPLHYVTYVRIYDATPEVVYVGYTPGYIGSYVSTDLVVVYGSGWYYRPWIGAAWYSYPVTWGFGFGIVYNWWNPWRPCCFAAWPLRPYYRPWWGPWHHHAWHHRPVAGSRLAATHNMTGNGGRRTHNVTSIYGRWDRKAVRSLAHDSIRPDRAARSYAQLRPGSGFVVGPNGRRQNLGENTRRRDWKDSGADARNRAALPPIQRRDSGRPDAGGRRDLSMNERRNFIRKDSDGRGPENLPRIQTPNRRSNANEAPITPGRESPQGGRPQGPAPSAVQSPRPQEVLPERQRREPAIARRAEQDRAPAQIRTQPRQFAEPLRLPTPARERAPIQLRQERAAPPLPSAAVVPVNPPPQIEPRAQMPRAVPDARAAGGVLRERIERAPGAGAGRVESRSQIRGGGNSGQGDLGARMPGPRFGERQR